VARIDDGAAGGGDAQAEEAPKAPKPESAPAQAAAPVETKPEAVAAPEPTAAAPSEDLGPISPLVRRMAREHSIDLSAVTGTGAGGRITKADVEAYLARGAQAAPPPSAPAAAAAPYAP